MDELKAFLDSEQAGGLLAGAIFVWCAVRLFKGSHSNILLILGLLAGITFVGWWMP